MTNAQRLLVHVKAGCFGFLTVVLLVWLLPGCATISFLPVSVNEEGGIRFTRITEDVDVVRSPFVQEGRGNFSPLEFFDISKDGGRMAYMGWKNNKGNIYVKELRGNKATLQRTFRDNVFAVETKMRVPPSNSEPTPNEWSSA